MIYPIILQFFLENNILMILTAISPVNASGMDGCDAGVSMKGKIFFPLYSVSEIIKK